MHPGSGSGPSRRVGLFLQKNTRRDLTGDGLGRPWELEYLFVTYWQVVMFSYAPAVITILAHLVPTDKAAATTTERSRRALRPQLGRPYMS